MDYELLIQSVSTIGFPIVMCGVMFWFLTKEQALHKEEMLELRNVIAQNNEVLASLKQLIEDKLKDEH